MRFKLLEGKHHGPGDAGKTYKKGDIVQSNSDLVKIFPGKFSLESAGIDPEKPSKKAEKKTVKAADGKKSKKADAALSARGTDVTDKFPLAEEEGFLVFQRDKKFHVYEGEADTAPIKGGEGLGEEAVESFLKTYLDE